MKKLLALSVVVAMLLVSVPAMAQLPTECIDDCNEAYDMGGYQNPITTTATITGGSGSPGEGGTEPQGPDAPIIKCKWEYDMDVSMTLEECDCVDPCTGDLWLHDACPCTEGLQVKPILGQTVTVGYYAVVTDPQGVANVDRVYADIWHPDGQFKYQIELFPLGLSEEGYDKAEALACWDHLTMHHIDLLQINDVWAATVDPSLTALQDIYDELNENMAYLYYGEAEISYCQPGGWYYVGVTAFDEGNNQAEYLYNRFWYIPTSAIEIDFTSIDYGSVEVGTHKQIGGDTEMITPGKPTVRNIGNAPIELYVMQNHMGFGKTSGAWNVEFDARMTADGDYVYYYPDEEVQIPGVLGLCTLEKLDFSILVDKASSGLTYTGEMWLTACIHDESYVWNTPDDFIQSAPIPIPQIYPGPAEPGPV